MCVMGCLRVYAEKKKRPIISQQLCERVWVSVGVYAEGGTYEKSSIVSERVCVCRCMVGVCLRVWRRRNAPSSSITCVWKSLCVYGCVRLPACAEKGGRPIIIHRFCGRV